MTTYNWHATDFQSLIEAFLTSMAHIYQHSQAVHLLDYLLAKRTHTMMGMLCFRSRIADIVIAIMTKSHIHDTSINKVLKILKFSIDSDTILDTQHDTLQPHVFVHPQVVRRAGYTNIIAVLTYDNLNLVEDAISISLGVIRRLRQISHHDGCILTTFGHLVQVYKNLSIAMVKVDTLWKEHWCVTMSIERQNPIVGSMSLTIALGLSNKPLEQRQALFQTLRMPLNTQYRLKLGALHRLNNAISRFCNNSEFVACLSHSLMME